MIIGALMVIVCVGGEETSGLLPATVIIMLLGYMIFAYGSEKKKEQLARKRERLEHERNYKQRMEAKGATCYMGSVEHMSGLPIAEGSFCDIFVGKEYIEFERNGSEYRLPMRKITDVSIKNESEIHEAYVSSIGDTIAGAQLFGTMGAIIGGRVRKKLQK